eukprot:3808022-Rhodomonas_salina.1
MLEAPAVVFFDFSVLQYKACDDNPPHPSVFVWVSAAGGELGCQKTPPPPACATRISFQARP